MPKSKENTNITKQTSLTDDYEVILSGTKSPLKTEEDKAQKSFEENKIEDHLEETSCKLLFVSQKKTEMNR